MSSQPSKQTTSSRRTTSSRQSTPYYANYGTKLAEARVFLTEEVDENDDFVMPANHGEITTHLDKARSSLSSSRFTAEDLQKFRKEAQCTSTETATMQRVVSTIEGPSIQFDTLNDLPFNNIEPFDPDVAIAKPDQYDGALPRTIDYRVFKSTSKHIAPSTDPSRPAAPNFFMEGKSRMGRSDVAQRLAAHNGAIGARGRLSLQSYATRIPQYDRNAYSFTNTYHDRTLKMYTTHVRMDTGGHPTYHMAQLNTFGMTGSSKAFREGATCYRNARDLAKEQRDNVILQANRAAQRMPIGRRSSSSRSNTSTTSISRTDTQRQGHRRSPDTSADDLTLEDSFKHSSSEPISNDD